MFFFSKIEYFMYFLIDWFFGSFVFSIYDSVHIFGVDEFGHQSGSDNIGSNHITIKEIFSKRVSKKM
jgi:hypothetical protein